MRKVPKTVVLAAVLSVIAAVVVAFSAVPVILRIAVPCAVFGFIILIFAVRPQSRD